MMNSRFLVAIVMTMGVIMPLCGMDDFTGWMRGSLSQAPELEEHQSFVRKYFNPEHDAKSGTMRYVQAGSVSPNDVGFTLQLPIVPGNEKEVPVSFNLPVDELRDTKSVRIVSKRFVGKQDIPARYREKLIWDIGKQCVEVGFIVTPDRQKFVDLHKVSSSETTIIE